MARQQKNAHNYATQYEDEGRRWVESHAAESLGEAELDAKHDAHKRGLRVVTTLPMNPEV